MKAKHSEENLPLQSQNESRVKGREQNSWRPVHPFLRCVSGLLSVVIAFSVGSPVQQAYGQTVLSAGTLTSGTIYITSESTMVPLNTGSGTTGGTVSVFRTAGTGDLRYVSSGTLLANSDGSKFNLRVEPHINLEPSAETPLTVTLMSGSLIPTPKLASLFIGDPSATASVAGKFEGLYVVLDTQKVTSLSLYNPNSGSAGLTIQNGVRLSFSGDSVLSSGSQNILLAGTVSNHTWNIGDSLTATPSFLAGQLDLQLVQESAPLRVENTEQTSSGKKTLTVNTRTNYDLTSVPYDQADSELSAAVLNIGPNIDLEKRGTTGNVYLQLSGEAKAFTGNIKIVAGGVLVGDGFLQGAPATPMKVSFEPEGEGTIYLGLRLSGRNAVTMIQDLTDYVSTSTRPFIEANSADGAMLVLEAGSNSLELPTLIRDGGGGANPMTVVKRGTGIFTPLNAENSFSGGLTLEAGTLNIQSSSYIDENYLKRGPIGSGRLTVMGNLSDSTLRIGTPDQPEISLSNDVTLKGWTISNGSNSNKTTKVRIEGHDPGTSGGNLTLRGNVIVEGEEGNDSTRMELSLASNLNLNIAPDSNGGNDYTTLSVAGTLILSGGGTLTLAPEMSSNILGDFSLQGGTLAIGKDATQTGISISGNGGARHIVVLGEYPVLVESDSSNTTPVWESSFTFSGGSVSLQMNTTAGTQSAIAIRDVASVEVKDGTLMLGQVQRTADAQKAVLKKTGLGTLAFLGALRDSGTLGLTSLELSGPVLFSALNPVFHAGSLVVSDAALQVDAGGSLSVSGPTSGTGFTKTGTGALSLSGVNTISGTTTLSSGQLSLASGAGAIRVGDNNTSQGETLTLTSTGTIGGSVSVGMQGSGASYNVTLASAGTSAAFFKGPITVNSTAVQLGLQAADGGVLQFSGAWSLGSNQNPVTVGAPGKAGTVTLASPLSTPSKISVVKGSLQVGVLNALATSPVDLDGGASLFLGTFNTTSGAVYVKSGNISGTGILTPASITADSGTISARIAGGGALQVNGNVTVSGQNTGFTGETIVTAGVLTVASSQALTGSPLTIQNPGAVAFAADSATLGGLTVHNNTTPFPLTTAASGPLALTINTGSNSNLNIELSGPGSLTKAGAGELELLKPPTYSGQTTVSAGSLTLSAPNFLQGNRLITNDGTINLTLSAGAQYDGTLQGTGTINLKSEQSVTLTLGGNAKLSGTFVLTNVTLDLSKASNITDANTTLKIGQGASVQLGSTTQNVSSLVLNGGSLLGSQGSKLRYGSLNPAELLNESGQYARTGTAASPNIQFEVLSKKSDFTIGALKGLLVTAGQAGTADGLDLLYIQPETNATRTIIDSPLELNVGVVVTTGTVNGTRLSTGYLSIQNTLTLRSGSIKFGQGIEATLTQSGSLNAAALDNSGRFIVDVTGDKVVDIPITGSGSLEKRGIGTGTLTVKNSYLGGTTLTSGVLEIGTAAALGSTGAVSFAGGTLRYGSGVNVDLSSRIAIIGSGTTAGIDTGANTVTYNAVLRGEGGIAKLGGGTLILAAANEFTGSTRVLNGILQVGTGGSTGVLAAATSTVESNAVLRFLRSDAASYTGGLSGTGTVEQTGTGLLTLEGQNGNFNGTLRLTQGALSSALNPSFNGRIEFNGGTLRYVAAPSWDLSSKIGPILSGQLARIDTNGQTVNFATGLDGGGGLEKLGAGTLVLNAANVFTGPTNVTEGLLNAGIHLKETSAINVKGGILEATSYKSSARLTVEVNGTARFTDADGTQEFDEIINAGILQFNGDDVKVSRLSGSGTATFQNDASLNTGVSSGISAGNLTVNGDLNASKISGGVISAAGLYWVSNGAAIGVDVSGGKVVITGPQESKFGAVSGGTIELSRGARRIDSLNGGNILNNGTLTVYGGTMSSGSISGDGSLTKLGSGNLTLNSAISYTGDTQVSQGTLFVGGLATGAAWKKWVVASDAQANFTDASGTVRLAELDNDGKTVFAGSAVIGGSSGTIAKGTIEAGALSVGTILGGTVNLTGGASNVTQLTNGSINLGTAASLSVSTGTFNGTLTGTGTLNKVGDSALSLVATPVDTLKVNVQTGSLTVSNLLTAARAVSVGAGGYLNTTVATGSFNGSLAGSGTINLVGSGTLTLTPAGRLGGNLNIGNGLSIDVSQTGETGVDSETSMIFLGASQLFLGAQQVEIRKLVLNTASQILSSGSSTIFYDDVPVVLDGGTFNLVDPENNNLLNPNYRQLVSTNVNFEENSVEDKVSILPAGTRRFVAGRVKMDLAAAVSRLQLDPVSGKTIRISGPIPNVSQEIVATGTGAGGFVTVGTLVTTPRFSIGNGIQATFTQAGSLASSGVFVNNGTLKFSVLSDTKSVGNQISGSGTLEKIDAGKLILTGANPYTGMTKLSGGVLQAANADAIGSGPIVFNGGILKYGEGVSKDFSSRIANIEADKTASIDTGTNTVTFASALGGSGGVSKLGDGTLVFAAENTFNGVLGVVSGAAVVGKGTIGSLAASTAEVAAGALLSFARDNTARYAGVFTGNGRIEQAGSGELILDGDGTAFAGTFALSNGTTVLNDPKALAGGTLLFNGGTLRYGVSAADLSSRIGSLSSTARVDTNGFDVAYANGLTGEAGLTKYGEGTLSFSGKNTYAGLTTVTAGTLRYTGDGLQTLGTVSTLTNSRVVLSVAGGSATFGGTVTGSGMLEKDGPGTLTLGISPLNTGSLTVAAGRLDLGRNVRLSRAVDLKQDTVLNVSNGILASTASLTLGGTLQVGNGVMFVKSLARLTSGTVTLDPEVLAQAPEEAFATIFAESLSNAELDTETLLVRTYTPGVVSGSLRGPVKGIPEGSALTLLPNDFGKVVSLADPEMRLASLDVAADVKLRVAEDVSVAGNITILGGSLTVEAGLKAPSGTVLIGGTSASGAVIGSVTAAGSLVARALTLTGKSNLVVANPAALRGVAQIQIGALSVGNTDARKEDAQLNISQGTLTLAEGQTLTGSGNIIGNVELGPLALLSPGNSPGTMHLAGTLNLTSGIVRVEVGTLAGGGLIQDQIKITSGTVVIGGPAGQRPTFQIVDTDGVLSSGGSLKTIFVDASENPLSPTEINPGVIAFARQSSTGAVLPSVMYASTGSLNNLQVQRLRFLSFAGTAPNIRGFANALDTRILTQKASTDGLLELGTGINSTASVPEQLAAALPSVYTEMAAISTQRTLNIHQGLVGHFNSLRANLRDFPEAGYNAWTTGYGASNRQDGNRALGTAGFSASTWGDMFGVEQRIGGFLLGVTGAAGRTSANFASTPGSVTTDSWHGGLYSVINLEPALIESGILFGSTDSRVRRTISAPGLTSRQGSVNLSGTEWVANVGLALPVVANENVTLTPSARFISQSHSQGAATESNMSGLEVSLNKQKTVTFQHQAGVELRRKLTVSGLPAAASLQLDWIHNYNAKGRNLNMALSGDPTAIFGYRGSNAGADSIHVGGAFEAALNARTSLRIGAEYQTQTALSTIRGSLSIGYQF